jgi:hypothetical protein
MPAENERLVAIDQATDAPLHTAVGLGNHPRQLGDLGPVLLDGHAVGEVIYRAGRVALKSMYAELSNAHAATEAVQEIVQPGRDSRTRHYVVPEARKAELANALASSFSRAAKVSDGALAQVDEGISQISGRIEAAISNPNKARTDVALEAGEIRQHIRSLPHHERRQFVVSSIEQGDHQVMTAVVGASPFASGLDREAHALLRAYAAEKFAPKESAQLGAAQKVRNAVLAAGAGFVQQTQRLLPKVAEDPKSAAVRRLRDGG